ncbi:ferric reductase like transmembrane component-domain-containing protein [Aspergillus ambiguus]|uniref:ferric reductase family protein n=1 Tax=Aspergillus ambiguus TaxID=176160 RepID=UPI003CCD06DB
MGVDELKPGEHRAEGGNGPHPPMNPALATPLYVLGGALVMLFVGRSIVRFRHRRRLQEVLESDDQEKFSQNSILTAQLKKHLFYAPFLTRRHSREFRLLGRIHMGTIPLRPEVTLLALYLAINMIFFFVLIDWWQDYKEVMFQVKYAAGHLAVMNSPVLVLTAGRNNPLIWLLGISFDTFNLFHRWIGRLMIVGAIVHMSCVVASEAREMPMIVVTKVMWHTPFFIYGLVALIAFVMIFFQSLSPIRHAFYEAFLHFHILLAIMGFVGLWYHLEGLALQRVLLATVILWGLDRAARLTSLIWRNFGKKRTTATVELLPGDVARVDVALARSWFFKAGQYMYLYIPSLGLWTSHPFSIAWTSPNRGGSWEKRGSQESFNLLLGEEDRQTVSFLIKRRDGFTRKLLDKVDKSNDGRFSATAFAEGPFGGLHTLSSYGTVMLVAGGIGITHPLSYMHDFVDGFATHKIAVRRVKLVWAVRSRDHLSWIQPWMSSLLNHPALQVSSERKQESYFQFPDFALSVQIYVTGSPDGNVSDDFYSSDETPWATSAPPSVPVNVYSGKPSFREILDTEMAQQVGAMAVSVCGPGGMGDDLRAAVRERQGRKTVDLYEEVFSW